MPDPRVVKLADVIVNYSLGVTPGQVVRVGGTPLAEPLLVELYRAVLQAGGHPLLRVSIEACEEMELKLASDQQLDYVSPIALHEMQAVDAYIGVWSEQNTRLMSNIDPDRIARQSRARRPIMEVMMKRAAEGKMRWVGTQFPTLACAQDAEMSLREYEDFVYSAGLLDQPDPVAAWRQLSEKQQRMVDFLNGKKHLRVRGANGTDLQMSIEGRRWINCDGHENFPDGEVFSGPVVESVEGTIHFSFPGVHNGREVQDVKLTFKNGKVVDASAGKGEDFLFSMLDMDEGSRFLGECAIGTNYGITKYTRNTLFDEKIGGTVHFALGAGYPETGNTNESGLHWDLVLDLRTGGTIEIDGQTISTDGRFHDATWPAAK